MDTTKKFFRSILFSISFVGFSINLKPVDNAQTNSTSNQSLIKELVEVQKKASKEIDSLLESKDIGQNKLPEDLQSNLEQLHEAAGTLKKQTAKLLKSHKQNKRSFWDNIFEEMEESQKAFGRFFSGIQENLKTKSLSTNNYRVQESLSQDEKTYAISLSMPGFSQEQIKVSIEETKRSGQQYNSLKISANNNNDTTKSQIVTKQDSLGITKYSSSQLASSYYINGRLLKTNFKDGKLEAFIDLPSTAQPNKYTMTFDEGILKIEFENNAPGTKTKALEFKKKEHRKENCDK